MQNVPLQDKDGSVRWDYFVRIESWEDDEYVITLGGKPHGRTLGLYEARVVSDWLITGLPEILRRDTERMEKGKP